MNTEWKTVPVEPTDAMLSVLVNIPVHGRAWGIDAVGLQRVWDAMLAAAPQPIPTGDATDSDWGAFVEASEDER